MEKKEKGGGGGGGEGSLILSHKISPEKKKSCVHDPMAHYQRSITFNHT